MKSEFFINLPDGKTVLPAQLIINKMGSSVVLDVKAQLEIRSLSTEEKKNARLNTTEIDS